MIKFNPTKPILFYKKSGGYVKGEGANNTWAPVITNALFCEWKGGYGDRAIAAEAVGVSDMATIRTFYHPIVYKALRESQVVVIKNADATAIVEGEPDEDNSNTYELWGGADDINEENQFMEFRVRRYEAK